jgi:DNA-binding NtrC family response regulator/pSer/pThr/pTyr-binding forkhead associated (FHA) protein
MSDTKLTEVDTHVATRPKADTERVTLVVYDGDVIGGSTKVLEVLDGAQVSFGRSRGTDVRIDSERVSRTHAIFSRHGLELTVVDAGSRNGTWVNGELISESRRLVSGDEVLVGSATVVVSITTGVVARPRMESTRYLEERLAAEVDRGLHYQRRFGLVLLQLSGLPDVTDEASDRVSAALRPMEVIAEYAPGLLAVVMPELDATAAERAARMLVATASTRRGEPVSGLQVAVGVAAFPEHSTTVGGLIARARAALEAVRRLGNDVVGVPPEDPDPAAAEVIVGDPQMARVYELVRKVADHPITVLVRGETGVGKEIVAGAIHTNSSRRTKAFVRLNCASLPETLLESELFGHEKGSFTGADRRKTGYFEAADGGTLFLDEIGEMTPGLQAKLLRVLEQRRITRVGGTEEIEVDVRVVCATHRDLEAESRRGAFRVDLFFRISAFTILVPPLRDRPAEIELLAKAFIQQSASEQRRRPPTLSPAASAALHRYSWPGNVRELRNAIERALVLHSDGVIRVEDLPESVCESRPEITTSTFTLDGQHDVRDHIAELERVAIATALEASKGNQTDAAKQLGISRRTLIYRMEKHGLKPPPPGARK